MACRPCAYHTTGDRVTFEVFLRLLKLGYSQSEALAMMNVGPQIRNTMKRLALQQTASVDLLPEEHYVQALYSEVYRNPVPESGLKRHALSHLPPFTDAPNIVLKEDIIRSEEATSSASSSSSSSK